MAKSTMLAPDIYQRWNDKYKKDMAYQVRAENMQIAEANSEIKTKTCNHFVENAEMIVTTGDKTVGDAVNVLPSNNRLVNAVNTIKSRYASNNDAINSISSYGTSSFTTGDAAKDLKKIEKESTLLPEPTPVQSDPDNPGGETTGVNESSHKSTYNVSNLYRNSNVLNFNRNRYQNVITKQGINEVDIISTFDGGVITQRESTNPDELSSYKLSQNEYLTQNTQTGEDVFSVKDYNHEPFGHDMFHHPDINSNVVTDEHVRYRYSYGFDDIVATQMSISKVAGYISTPVNVENCLYIELSADVVDGVEYSVIDGKDEIPILPIEQSLIKREKLFYGLMPRFFIMNPSDIVVKHGEEILAISSLEDLELFLSVNNTDNEVSQSSFLREETYTINYEPDTKSRIYYPKSNKIQVKIIQRFLDFSSAPASIGSVIIRKHQNKSSWYLSSFDMNNYDYNPNDIRVY